METKNIMIAGVGGQGTLLASKLLGRLLLGKGFDVKVSEVHGMSQRGGSVVTYVRWGEKVYSPIVDKGQADVILSFELLEAARWTEYLKKGGKIIPNTQQPVQRVLSITALPPVTLMAGQPIFMQDLQPTHLSASAEIGPGCLTYLSRAQGRRLMMTEGSAAASSSFTAASHSASS